MPTPNREKPKKKKSRLGFVKTSLQSRDAALQADPLLRMRQHMIITIINFAAQNQQ